MHIISFNKVVENAWIPAFAGMTTREANPSRIQSSRIGSIEKSVINLVIPAKAGIQIKFLASIV